MVFYFGLLANFFSISTSLASLILTLTLIAPNVPMEKISALPIIQGHDSPTALEAPKTPVLSIEEYAAEVAKEQGISPERLQRLITCESQWKEDAAGDHGTSRGILQFKVTTFAEFTKKYELVGYDITSPHDQIDLAGRMIKDGYLRHWKNCARKTGWTAAAVAIPPPKLPVAQPQGTSGTMSPTGHALE